MQYFIFFLTIVAMLILAKVLSWPLKKIFKMFINIFFGIILILLVNIFGVNIGLHISFNVVTAIIAGSLGIPGVMCLIIFNYIF